ncbi:MAG: hypothetical protein IPG34_07325 [Rhodocyclaceae bacterium]|nr:hypothetical protein [Rhodocyclaceae bacterium]
MTQGHRRACNLCAAMCGLQVELAGEPGANVLSAFAVTPPTRTAGVSFARYAPAHRGIRARGGRVVVIDPRCNETAEVAGEHVAIKPGGEYLPGSEHQ